MKHFLAVMAIPLYGIFCGCLGFLEAYYLPIHYQPTPVIVNDCFINWNHSKLREDISSNDDKAPCVITVQPKATLWFAPDLSTSSDAESGQVKPTCPYPPDYNFEGNVCTPLQ